MEFTASFSCQSGNLETFKKRLDEWLGDVLCSTLCQFGDYCVVFGLSVRGFIVGHAARAGSATLLEHIVTSAVKEVGSWRSGSSCSYDGELCGGLVLCCCVVNC